jgi:hypothetical protein
MSLQMERAVRSCSSWFCFCCSISTGVFGSINVLCNRVVLLLLLLLRLSTVALWFQVSYAQQPGGVVVGYYQNNGLCNADVEGIVTGIVSQATQADPTMPAGLLRLMFHDCWVQVGKAAAGFNLSQFHLRNAVAAAAAAAAAASTTF